MKNSSLLLIALFLLPTISHAQSLQVFITSTIKFLNTIIIPFLLGIGFLFFVINVIRYFVAGGSNEDDREKAKALAIYSVAAFVIIVTFWGIINMLASSTGLQGKNQPAQDYVKMMGG